MTYSGMALTRSRMVDAEVGVSESQACGTGKICQLLQLDLSKMSLMLPCWELKKIP